jgi:hypothetical protein
MLCDHRLSEAPSHPYQRPSRMFMSVGVLRSTSAAAAPRVWLSVQFRSGTWQVEHEKLPVADRRGSKKSSSPNTIASRLPDTRLLGSLLAGSGQGPCARMARISVSLKGDASSSAAAAHGRSTARAQPSAIVLMSAPPRRCAAAIP